MGGRRAGIRVLAAGCALLLAGCSGASSGAGEDKAADGAPLTVAKAAARLPVPRGDGSRTPDDFNGDGHRDLVLNDLVKSAEDRHGDDAGIGIVYGSERGLRPGSRQLLSPGKQAVATNGRQPAVFDAEASCDLDHDGFTDLLVSTDPPYDGQGMPPVPLQILFGSPAGLTGKAVKLTIPAQARYGNDWPDQPVCGDFDGDGAADLVVHASDGRISFLRGPLTRRGTPRSATTPGITPGNVPTGPAADVNGDGYDDVLVRSDGDASPATLVLGGPTGPTRTGALLPSGVDVAFGRLGQGAALDTAIGSMGATALRYDTPGGRRGELPVGGTVLDTGDFDGDGLDELVSSGSRLRIFPGRTAGPSEATMLTLQPPARGTTRVVEVADLDGDRRADLVVRSYAGESEDTVAVYPGRRSGVVARKPEVTFSTAEFLTSK